MSADDDLRFSETLVRYLRAARPKLVPYSVIEAAGLKKLQRFEREGRWGAGEAVDIARRVFTLVDAAGDATLGRAANELYVEAAALWRKDRAAERRARTEDLEHEAEWQARLDERLRREAEERRREAEHRWVALEYCTTDEFEVRIGRRHLRPLLKERGYLEGGVGSWAPTAKALEENAAKVEVRSRYSIILWSKSFVEALQSELRREGASS